MLDWLISLLQKANKWIVHKFPYLDPVRRGGVRDYVIAVVLMVLALAVRLSIAPVNAGLQYVTFFPAVTLATVIGGVRAGLLCTAIGVVLATSIFTPPFWSISIEVLIRSFWSNVVFLIDGIIISFSIEYMHRYRQQYQQELDEVKASEAHVTLLNSELKQTVVELKRAEVDLRIAAATFNSHEAIMITDAHANIIRVNQAFEKITGYSEGDVLGRNPRLLKSGRQDGSFYAHMWDHILKFGYWNGEIWDRHKSGNIYPKEMTITAVKNESGETTQYVAIFSDISDRKESEKKIHSLAFYDALTGLPNRRLLLDRLEGALLSTARTKRVGALLFLDMDNFKVLNDTMGHDFGDMMLIEVARRLKQCVRDVDTIARFGGDEFVVMLDDVGPNEVEVSHHIVQVAEKIRSVLAVTYQLSDHFHHSTPSIGVCLFSGQQDAAGELIKRADMAMYQAKESGRNKVRFFDPLMQQSLASRASLEADLRKAIDEQQILLHYQIQIDQDRRPIGAEALIRWNHPQRGFVSPADFIPLAEESMLIEEIGDWVLDTACRQLVTWSGSTRTKHLTLAVNVSAKQFKQPDFVERVDAILKKYPFDHSRLKLELTESVALDDLDFVVAKMLALKHVLGIKLSMDDFGTGYSSLSYLKQLPFDQIKIDQSFVRNLGTNSNDAFLVKTIIDMGINFGFDVIAEGVETESQFNFLRNDGCHAFQGNLFSKPVPIEQFDELIG